MTSKIGTLRDALGRSEILVIFLRMLRSLVRFQRAPPKYSQARACISALPLVGLSWKTSIARRKWQFGQRGHADGVSLQQRPTSNSVSVNSWVTAIPLSSVAVIVMT